MRNYIHDTVSLILDGYSLDDAIAELLEDKQRWIEHWSKRVPKPRGKGGKLLKVVGSRITKNREGIVPRTAVKKISNIIRGPAQYFIGR